MLKLARLNDQAALLSEEFGAKAANLAYLTQQGFLVPNGFCVALMDRFDPELVYRSEPFRDLVDELVEDGSSIIVRSSASVEDDVAALFAGRFRSRSEQPRISHQ